MYQTRVMLPSNEMSGFQSYEKVPELADVSMSLVAVFSHKYHIASKRIGMAIFLFIDVARGSVVIPQSIFHKSQPEARVPEAVSRHQNHLLQLRGYI